MKKTIHTKEQIDAAIDLLHSECINMGKTGNIHIFASGTVFISLSYDSKNYPDFESALNAPPPPSAADFLRQEIAEMQAKLAKLEGKQ